MTGQNTGFSRTSRQRCLGRHYGHAFEGSEVAVGSRAWTIWMGTRRKRGRPLGLFGSHVGDCARGRKFEPLGLRASPTSKAARVDSGKFRAQLFRRS